MKVRSINQTAAASLPCFGPVCVVLVMARATLRSNALFNKQGLSRLNWHFALSIYSRQTPWNTHPRHGTQQSL
eukprot:1149493-Pelagomonas_calceolata.AAC.3